MDNITNHPLYHPGEGPSIHVLSSEQRRYLAEQAASIERHCQFYLSLCDCKMFAWCHSC